MGKHEVYRTDKERLETERYIVENASEIDYGLQFRVRKGELEGLIRIYESKKAIRVDLSQVKSAVLKRQLEFLEARGDTREISLPKSMKVTGVSTIKALEALLIEHGGKKIESSLEHILVVYELPFLRVTFYHSGTVVFQGKASREADTLYKRVTNILGEEHRECLKQALSDQLEEGQEVVFDSSQAEVSEKYLPKDIFSYLHLNDQIDLADAIFLYELAREKKVKFINYAILVRNFAIVFEVFLIKVFLDLKILKEEEYKDSVHSVVGHLLNTNTLLPHLKNRGHNRSVIVDLTNVWISLRNKHLHSNHLAPGQIGTFEEAETYVKQILYAIQKFWTALEWTESKVSEELEELIGSDESGKGDYFGPLVVAAVYVNSEIAQRLRDLGVQDSKNISNQRIKELAGRIKKICPHSIVAIANDRFNTLYEEMQNLNKMLAWGHARAVENVLEKISCNNVLSDQFGDEEYIKNALLEKGKTVNLTQRPNAASNIAVTAARILARYEFLKKLANMERIYHMNFPQGASEKTIEVGRQFSKQHGRDKLRSVAKVNFKNTSRFG